MSSNSERIAQLLHLTRNGGSLTSDLAEEIARMLTTSLPHEVAHGTAKYFHDLIGAASSVLNIEHQALTAAAEVKDSGGALH